MNDLLPREYKEILRLDLGYSAQHCFCELNPQAAFLPNWHIEVIAAKLAAVRAGRILLRDKQDENTYCLTGECSRDIECCLTKRAPVASLVLRPSRSSSSVFINHCLLMLALWSCGRRVSVVQAQRQIHSAFRAVFTFAEVVLRSIAKRAAFDVVRRNPRIGSHGSEYHLVRGFSAPLLQATLQRPKLPVRVDVGVLSLQPPQTFARCMPRLCLEPTPQLGRDGCERIGPAPQSLGLRLCYAGRAYLTLPCRAQPREELLQC